MKTRIPFLLLTLFSIVACHPRHKDTTISGQIKGFKKMPATVMLEDISANNPLVVDTGSIDKSGAFHFKAHVTHKGLYQLVFGHKAGLILVLDSLNEDLQLQADSLSLQNATYSIEGSRPSLLIQHLFHNLHQMSSQLDSIHTAFQDASQAKQKDSLRLKDYFENRKVLIHDYLKTYVDTVSDDVVAIFITVEELRPDPSVTDDHAALVLLKNHLTAMKAHDKFSADFLRGLTAMLQKNDQDQQEGLPVGTAAPDITLQDMNGHPQTLSSLHGQIVLLDFWASWCGPCRKQNPDLVKIYEQFKGSGFTIFSVSLDQKKEDWMAAIQKDHLDWPMHVSELTPDKWGSKTAETYKVEAIPTNYLLDKQGKIIAKNLYGSALRDAIAKALQGK